jgi:hypothetical protein
MLTLALTCAFVSALLTASNINAVSKLKIDFFIIVVI